MGGWISVDDGGVGVWVLCVWVNTFNSTAKTFGFVLIEKLFGHSAFKIFFPEVPRTVSENPAFPPSPELLLSLLLCSYCCVSIN